MTRIIRRLGLGLAAVVALSACVASAAQAVPTFEASAYPGTWTGSNTSLGEVIGTDGGNVECDSHFVSNATSGPTSTLTVTPTYTGCMAFGFASATVSTEGCTYLLHATEKVSTGVYKHHLDIVCPTGHSIKIAAGTCKAEIKAQTGLTTVKTTNLAAGTVTMQMEIQGLAYTVTQDGFLCAFSGTGNTTNGTYRNDVDFARVGGGTVRVSGE